MYGKITSVVGLIAIFIFTSCGEYNKLLKSDDYEYKYEKAKEYCDGGDYTKSITLLRELITVYRGTSKSAEVSYYLAKSLLGQENYITASEVFKKHVREFPRSSFAEEAQYMVGYCQFRESELTCKPRLDQQSTYQAIDALELFIDIYPNSERVVKAEEMITQMREKLLFKSYLSSRLYYDLGSYKSAVISLGNSLKKYPDTRFREELMYMLFKAKFYLGERSVEEKKRERLNDALDEYYRFINEWDDSAYRSECDEMFTSLKRMMGLKDEDLNINL